MRYEEKLTIATPEGVELTVRLAGLGSRFAARLLDTLIQLALIYIVPMILGLFAGFGLQVTGAAPTDAFFLISALFFLWAFLVWFGYDMAFELLGGGRTPGKRALGIRVVRIQGQPVGFRESAVRNLVRLVDIALIGMISILVTSKGQRLGDIAAGTVVMRDRISRDAIRLAAARSYPIQPPAHLQLSRWDVSAIAPDEMAAARYFLERRWDLDPEARSRLAWELTRKLRPKVAGHKGREHPELFLEGLVNSKAVQL